MEATRGRDPEKEPLKGNDSPRDELPFKYVALYSIGHAGNDMMSAIWFGFSIFYLSNIAGLTRTQAAIVFLSGQVTDAACSPFVGYISDNFPPRDWPFWDKRVGWVLIGSLLASGCFVALFAGSWLFPSTGLVYFSICASVFNVGWAFVNINHMAMVAELSPSRTQQVRLNAMRFTVFVGATIMALVVGNAVFSLVSVGLDQFAVVAVVIATVGLSCTACFAALMPRLHQIPQSTVAATTEMHRGIRWRRLVSGLFFAIVISYTMARVVQVLLQTMMPDFAVNILKQDINLSTSLMLCASLGSVASTVALFRRFTGVSDLNGYAASTVLIAAAAALLGCAQQQWGVLLVHVAVFMSGMGCAGLIIFSQTIGTQFIGEDLHMGALVWGCLASFEKLVNGVVIMLLQLAIQQDSDWLWWSITLVPVGVVCVGCLATAAAVRWTSEGRS